MGFVMNTMNTINRPRCFWLKHVNGQKLWRRLWGSFLRHYCGGGYGVRFEDIVEVAMGSMWVEVAMGGPTDLVLYASGRSIKMIVSIQKLHRHNIYVPEDK